MPPQDDHHEDHHDEEGILAEDDALEEVPIGEDAPMDSDDEELLLQNDSIAYFDAHRDSVFSIAQHPLYPSLIATGGSAGEDDDAPGEGYIIDTSAAPGRPVLPPSYNADGAGAAERPSLDSLFRIEGHTDSISALAFSLPGGEYLVSGGMDGRLRAHAVNAQPGKGCEIKFLGEAQEVPEVNWIEPCPAPEYPNTFAIGASDGSVWVYTVDGSDAANPLQINQSYFLHTGSCTAGAWTPNGSLLATISEDVTMYVWDVWGLAAANGLGADNGTAMSLTGADQRFNIEGGLYSLAIDPTGAFAALGGAGGAIRIISMPRVTGTPAQPKGKGKGKADPASGGQILASLQLQTETIETLAFTSGAQTLLAAGSVDGSIAVFDPARRFAMRRHMAGAHEEQAVVQVEFIKGTWLLTSCGMDGVVRRWDLKAGGVAGAAPVAGAAAGAAQGLVKEWKGHRGDGEGGGVLGFVQGETGERVVTAGDDGVVLVFEA